MMDNVITTDDVRAAEEHARRTTCPASITCEDARRILRDGSRLVGWSQMGREMDLNKGLLKQIADGRCSPNGHLYQIAVWWSGKVSRMA